MDGEPFVHPLVRDLIGCAWGHRVRTPDDAELCHEQASQIVVLHDAADRTIELRVCQHHLDKLRSLTDPHHDRRN